MSNHYHLVIKLSPEEAKPWSHQEVIERWTTLFKAPLLVQRHQQGLPLSLAEQQTVNDIIKVWHSRLQSISWFMKCLNEPIAKQANKEDQCTGHFWESRYKSQALLTKAALLSCMAYVDLNPVRANMAKTPETSDHTSIKERVSPCFNLQNAIKSANNTEPESITCPIKPLLYFIGNETSQEQTGIPFDFKEYLILLDLTGRVIREDKKSAIKQATPPILERLHITADQWINNCTQFEAQYQRQFQRRRSLKS